jgi:uncharacterized Zn-finger protein
VINGLETDFTTPITAETTINKANFTSQLFNTSGTSNIVPDLPIEERATYFNTSLYDLPSPPSSVTTNGNPELMQFDIPKYRSTPPHSRSYSDHFPYHDQYPRGLSTSPPSSTSSVSKPPQVYEYLQQHHKQQHHQQQQVQQATTRHHHHRRTTSDITPFPHESRKSTEAQYWSSNKSSASSDEEILAAQQPPSSNTHFNRYQCSQCSKTFSRPSSLRIHIFSHTGEKPHQCPHPGCGRRFSVQSNMRRHLKVHYCGPQSQKDQDYLGKLPLTDQQSNGYDVFIAEGSNTNSNDSGDFYRYSSVSRA